MHSSASFPESHQTHAVELKSPDHSVHSVVDALRSKGKPTTQVQEFAHIQGFDYLRVFFMLMVLLAHGNFFWGMGDARQAVAGPGPNLWDFLYFQLQSTAVPSFVLMSMLLFSVKTPTWARSWDRVKKLGYLYGFWVGAWILCSKSRPEPGLYGWFEFAIRGGGWVLYTFVVLMLLTPLCVVADKLARKTSWLGILLSALVVVGTFLYLRDGFKWVHRYYYWVPTCFVMMPFVAVFLVPKLKVLQASSALRWKWVGILLLIGAACALVEWQLAAEPQMLTERRSWLPKHARLSVQFCAIGMIVASLGIKSRPNAVVRYFANNSLGVYCLHPFVLRGIMEPVKRIVDPIFGQPGLSTLAGCAAVAVVCSLVSEFLRRAFKQRLI